MKKGIWLFILLSPLVSATSLLEVYELAKQNEPDFLQAHSQYLVKREDLSLAYAALAPSVNLSGQYAYQVKRDNGSEQRIKTPTQQLSLRLNQPIFNAEAWSLLAQAKASVKQAEAIFQSETQTLFYKVAEQYLAASVAAAHLDYAAAKVRALNAIWDQVNHQWQAGLAAKAAVDEALSAFNSAKVEKIDSEQEFADEKEGLFRLTGEMISDIDRLWNEQELVQLPSMPPQSSWTALALQQNFQLKAAQWAMQAAKAKVKSKARSRVPEIAASATYDYDHASTTKSGISHGPKAGLSLSWRLYEGGAMSADQRKASWSLMGAKASMLKVRRAVQSSSQQAYRDVHLGSKKVAADKQSLLAKQSALASIRAAFSANERAITDVLDAESNVFAARQQWIDDLRFWILAMLRLKQVVGQLSYEDLEAVSDLMQQSDAAPKPVSESGVFHQRPYVIQLASSHDEAAIHKFMRQHHLVGKAYTRPSSKAGLFLVLVGAYKTKEEAEKALRAFPADWLKWKPWVRRLSNS